VPPQSIAPSDLIYDSNADGPAFDRSGAREDRNDEE